MAKDALVYEKEKQLGGEMFEKMKEFIEILVLI